MKTIYITPQEFYQIKNGNYESLKVYGTYVKGCIDYIEEQEDQIIIHVSGWNDTTYIIRKTSK